MAQDRIRGPMRDFDGSTLGPKSSLWRGIKGEVNLPQGRGKVEDIEVTGFLTRHEPKARRINSSAEDINTAPGGRVIFLNG